MTKLEQLTRELVAALEANDASGWMDARTATALAETRAFLNYLATPEQWPPNSLSKGAT